ncbi:DUF4126 family protein [Aestuariicella hydrocarbonica]|uniref:DUF4126 family protein n=1 Tax=Pseudomaricurvus hydrocarbonicus TaxID=1470433 RepID=A0A9E5JR59_9GAMM|nr:DUF4126 family protein [Aestuariicella hydrocarbonica]NHO64033.1 DUF4126 family protein [Aestuariicella hydrocarbonica]
MESYQALLATLALSMGASWASGINLYAVLLVLGIGGSTGNIDLPPDLQVLADPMVIGAAGLMYFVEFFVDKTPGVDTAWDTLHTFIRIPAGAMLAAGAVGDVTPALEIAAGIMGGALSATSHVTKTGTRALINTSPEPFSNWGASISEDIVVFTGLWTALNYPLVFLCLLFAFVVLAIWVLPKIWRVLKAIVLKIGGWLGMRDAPPPAYSHTSGMSPIDFSLAIDNHPVYSEEQLRQIEALQCLKEAGKISEEEFLNTKKKILGEE